MATRIPGYRRKPGLSRRYLTPEGREISYRQYRTELERLGAVRRLEAVQLANVRRRQKEFNQIVRQMAKVRGQALDAAIENTEAALERVRLRQGYDATSPDVQELAERLAMYRRSRRRVKQEAIRSPARKEAIRELESVAGRRVFDPRTGVRRYRTREDELRAREALIALGRRENVPEWVPVGYSDKPRTWRRFRPVAAE